MAKDKDKVQAIGAYLNKYSTTEVFLVSRVTADDLSKAMQFWMLHLLICLRIVLCGIVAQRQLLQN